MTAIERRQEIMRILTARRSETAPHLARELGVCLNTIRTDIKTLTREFPLETSRGNGGCVRVAEWYHPHRNMLSLEQQTILSQLMETATEQQREVLRQMLVEYGSPKYRQTMNGGKYAGCRWGNPRAGILHEG